MRVFKFMPPYKPNGRTTMPETKAKSGVYLIKENGKLVYVGYSGYDLYRTMYRHFSVWNDVNYRTGKVIPPEARVTYKSRMKRNHYTVRVVFCTPAQAARLEKMLIIKHQPRDNTLKYDAYEQTKFDLNVVDAYFGASVDFEAPF